MPTVQEVATMEKAPLLVLAERMGLAVTGRASAIRNRVIKQLEALQVSEEVPAPIPEDVIIMGERQAPRERPKLGTNSTDASDTTSSALTELANAILKLGRTRAKRARDSSDDDESDEEDNRKHPWKTTLKMRVPEVKLRKEWLRWDLPYVYLSPIMWILMEWQDPLPDTEWEGRLGTHGPQLLALRALWKEAWAISDTETLKLGVDLLSVLALVRARKAESTPDGWCRIFFVAHVAPLLRTTRLLQAARYRADGRPDLAARMALLAEGETHVLGADVENVAQKAMNKGSLSSTAGGTRHERLQDRPRKEGHQSMRIWCRVCHAHFEGARGEKRTEAYARHNSEKKHPIQ